MLTERQAQRLADRLRDFPRLAATATMDGAYGSTVGSPSPAGVLARVDAGREHPHLLARLEQCTTVVRQEMPADTFERAPDRSDRPTWETESAWLVATMGWWQADDWCCEWISGEVKSIRYALIGLIERYAHYRTCGVCGAPIEAYRTGDYALAECPQCERVVGMAEVGYRERIEQARLAFVRAIGGA